MFFLCCVLISSAQQERDGSALYKSWIPQAEQTRLCYQCQCSLSPLAWGGISKDLFASEFTFLVLIHGCLLYWQRPWPIIFLEHTPGAIRFQQISQDDESVLSYNL